MKGFVSLVGAGPGDAELLTLRALRRLEAADLVLFDSLTSAEVRALAPNARRFPVAGRAGRRTLGQETIHALMIRAAGRGARVVRLKCGDPCVFGRGGEEALALAAAGVAFEIVPGVSSAIAAPALAGIPVTHRGIASALVVVTGHSRETYEPILSSIAPASATLVLMMSIRSRGAIAELLVRRGWPGSTPVAICEAASTSRATRTLTFLDALHATPAPSEAATIIVGDVVRLAEEIVPTFSGQMAGVATSTEAAPNDTTSKEAAR